MLPITKQSTKPRLIFLTGAPISDELDWSDGQISHESDATFGRQVTTEEHGSSNTTTPSKAPKWRSVTACQPQLEDVTVEDSDDQPEFLSTTNVIDELVVPEHDEEFADRSFELLEDNALISSRDDANDPVVVSLESIYSSLSGPDEQGSERPSINTNISKQLHITDLRRIPNATHLQQSTAGTKQVNLLVGIIAIQPLRTVQLRRRNAQMDLIEVIVGDDTKAGFSITMWLVPEKNPLSRAIDIRPEVTALRTGDLVLFTNIALSVYKSCVYGQSISRLIARNSTKIIRVDEHRFEHTELARKINNVRDWTQRFLGIEYAGPQRRIADDIEALPPETPDG